jgi:hypothetical protein
MWIYVLCPIENEITFHDLKCLKGKFDSCGIAFDMPNGIGQEEWKNHELEMLWKSCAWENTRMLWQQGMEASIQGNHNTFPTWLLKGLVLFW